MGTGRVVGKRGYSTCMGLGTRIDNRIIDEESVRRMGGRLERGEVPGSTTVNMCTREMLTRYFIVKVHRFTGSCNLLLCYSLLCHVLFL